MAVRGSGYICLPVTNNYNIVIVVLHSMFIQNFGTLANLPCKTQKFWVQLAKTMKFLKMLQKRENNFETSLQILFFRL